MKNTCSLLTTLISPFVLLYNAGIAVLRTVDRTVGKLLWPEGTKRHTVVQALINIRKTISTGVYYLKMQGLSGFINLIKYRWQYGNVSIDPLLVGIPVEPIQPIASLDISQTADPFAFEIESERVATEASVGVSVIIPTVNGSHDLLNLLPTLKVQKGFRHIEVIIVDSGSTDDTIQIAKEYGATVITIPSKEFSHSGSRNLGAKQATQEFLLFMTQDALPPNDLWLNELYLFQQANTLAAVSCMEVPKVDADLFSRVENWYHYNFLLDLDGSDRILSKPTSSDVVNIRKYAQISDVSCLIPRELFLRYRFRGEYAEDLDLGLRLINNGHRLGLLSSVKIIHSHTRHPIYYLKRGYIDKLVITQILNEPLEESAVGFQNLMSDTFYTLKTLQRISSELFQVMKYPIRFDEFRRIIKEKFVSVSYFCNPENFSIKQCQFIDEDAVSILTSLYRTYNGMTDQTYQSVLLPHIGAFHDITFRYMESIYEAIDKTIADDFQLLTYKYFLNLVGRCLAVCYIKNESEYHDHLQFIDKILRDSI